MSWLNATRPEIKLTSPNNSVYYGLWRGGERSVEKKLGIFSIPNFNGDIIQDLNVKSVAYPITFYFTGLNHHQEAEAFFIDFAFEVGQWEIVHPTKGILILQGVSAREVISPVEDANTTTIETQWLEPANIERIRSKAEIAAGILATIEGLKDKAGDLAAMAQQLRTDLYAAIQSYVSTLNQAMGYTDSIMRELTATNALKQDSYNESRSGLNNTLNNFGINNPDASDTAVATLEVMLSVVGDESDFTSDYPAFDGLIDDILTLTPINTAEKDYNTVVAQELTISSILIALAQSIIVSDFASRADIISAMENITNIFNNTIIELDEIQNKFGYIDIDKQYYALTATYSTIMNLYALVMQYLIEQFYNLKTEKIIILKNPRTPLEITVTEYGELGIDDVNLDLLINSNNLTGDEIYLCPAGKEIKIYAS